ncbi:MAG: transposase [Hyphomicrobiales bacterium]|nr:transposase [Hyphomicrobiales bacterium]
MAGRNRLERFFGRLKEYRRIASRYGETAEGFLHALRLVTGRIWLSHEATVESHFLVHMHF